MRPSTIWYTLKQGIKNIKRNWMFSIASILTMAACIFLVGVFYSLVTNVDNIAQKVEQEVPVTVFFDEGTTEEQMQEVGNLIQARPEVERVEFESADRHGRTLRINISRDLMRQKDLRMTTRLSILQTIMYT